MTSIERAVKLLAIKAHTPHYAAYYCRHDDVLSRYYCDGVFFWRYCRRRHNWHLVQTQRMKKALVMVAWPELSLSHLLGDE